MPKLRVHDHVIVISGADKGRRGEILRIMKDGRYVVSGVKMQSKHVKPNPQAGVSGGIDRIEGPIHSSNLAIFNAETDKADRVGFRFEEDESGKSVKMRYYKSTGAIINEE